MLKWAAEHATENTATAVEEEFGNGATDIDRRAPHLDAVRQQMHMVLIALTNHHGARWPSHTFFFTPNSCPFPACGS